MVLLSKQVHLQKEIGAVVVSGLLCLLAGFSGLRDRSLM